MNDLNVSRSSPTDDATRDEVEAETCVRCGNKVPYDSPDFDEGEADPDGNYICKFCLTDAESETL